MLSDLHGSDLVRFPVGGGLNAPFGARCFLTFEGSGLSIRISRHNAPFGARCFLTWDSGLGIAFTITVLMHLLALGAFWPDLAHAEKTYGISKS